MFDASRLTNDEADVLVAALRAYEQGMRAMHGRSRSVKVRNDTHWRAWVADDLVREIVTQRTPARARTP